MSEGLLGNKQGQTGEKVGFDYTEYDNRYSTNCLQWKSQPVYERKCNDICCVVTFFLITAAFLAGGTYYILEWKSINQKIQLAGEPVLKEMAVAEFTGVIAGGMGLSLILAVTYIVLVKSFPKCMVYTLIGLSLSLLALMCVVGVIIGNWALVASAGVTLLIYMCVLACFREKIKVGIVLVKVAGQFITERPSIFLSPIPKILMTLIFSVFWIYSISTMFAVVNHQSSIGEDTTAGSIAISLWVLLYLFYSFLFYYIMVFTIAVCCSFWYYQITDRSPYLHAYKWMFSVQFGSLVFASLLIAIITFARMLVDGKRSNNKNIAVAICLCIISCILKSIQRLLQILNHNAVIVMAVTGENYIDSARTTIGLLFRNLPLLYISNLITNLLLFWGIIICSVLPAILGYFATSGKEGQDRMNVITLIFLGSLMLSTIILSVLGEAASSVFIFYCFDLRFKDMGMGAHNMPEEINQALGNYRQFKGVRGNQSDRD